MAATKPLFYKDILAQQGDRAGAIVQLRDVLRSSPNYYRGREKLAG